VLVRRQTGVGRQAAALHPVHGRGRSLLSPCVCVEGGGGVSTAEVLSEQRRRMCKRETTGTLGARLTTAHGVWHVSHNMPYSVHFQTPIHGTGAQGQDQGAQAGVRMPQGMAQGAATAQPMPARSSPKSNLDWEYYQGGGGFVLAG
jgi:hypothetical protein